MADFDALAARQSRTSCPSCRETGTMTLGRTFRAQPVGDYSLAGVQPKVSAREVYTITCDPAVGGCGWTAEGHYEGAHFVTDGPQTASNKTKESAMTQQTIDPYDPQQTHPDPAVQALIEHGWLGEWDHPIGVDNLEGAVALVRDTDAAQRAADQVIAVRVEWAAEARYYDGTVKRQPGADEQHAALMAESMAYHLSTLNEPTRRAKGVKGAVLVRREIHELPDGWQRISPWRHQCANCDGADPVACPFNDSATARRGEED